MSGSDPGQESPHLQESTPVPIFSHRAFRSIHFSPLPGELYEVFGLHPCDLVQPYCGSFLTAEVCALAHITKNERGAYSETQMYSLLPWHMLPTL